MHYFSFQVYHSNKYIKLYNFIIIWISIFTMPMCCGFNIPDYKERDLVALTDAGPIRGHVVNVDAPGSSAPQPDVDPGVVSWVGIPFAKPPIGELRWRVNFLIGFHY